MQEREERSEREGGGNQGGRELLSHLAGKDRDGGCGTGGGVLVVGGLMGGWGMSGWMGVAVSESERKSQGGSEREGERERGREGGRERGREGTSASSSRPGHEQGSLLMTASPSSTAMMRHGLDAAVQPGLRCCNMAGSEGEVCECGGWGVGGGEWLGRVVGGMV